MNKLIILLVVLFSEGVLAKFNPIQETNIYTLETLFESKIGKEIVISAGFKVDGSKPASSFEFRYTGNQMQICDLVDEASNKSMEDFNNGHEEYVKVESCYVKRNEGVTVDALFVASDDTMPKYESMSYKINLCEEQ